MYLRLTYLWVNKSYILDFKEENDVSREKLLSLCLKKDDCVMKNLRNYYRVKQQPL